MNEHERLSRIEGKIDKILEHQASMDVTLAKQNVEIAHHIRRTDQIEELIKPALEFLAFSRVALRWVAVGATLAAIYKALS